MFIEVFFLFFSRKKFGNTWVKGNFILSRDAKENKTISINYINLHEVAQEEKNGFSPSTSSTSSDQKSIEKQMHLPENAVENELELFGPKPMFMDDTYGTEQVIVCIRSF